jgi:tRNA-splicing ligase RtcB (3'-phosphate/5'-hydroxy nucleic acid ligase)
MGGGMGKQSFILAGASTSVARAFASADHGAGRQMSRHQALRSRRATKSPMNSKWARDARRLQGRGGRHRCRRKAGLARKVVRLEPMICIKG